jgi:hypothetical protein
MNGTVIGVNFLVEGQPKKRSQLHRFSPKAAICVRQLPPGREPAGVDEESAAGPLSSGAVLSAMRASNPWLRQAEMANRLWASKVSR